MGSFGSRLLLRLVLLGVGVLGIFVYEKFFEKPRLNYAAAAATPAGWNRVEVPAGHYSVALPPNLLIADPTRPDYAKNLAKVEKDMGPLLEEFTDEAARRDPKKLEALGLDERDFRVTQVSVSAVREDEATDDSDQSVEELRKAVAKESPELIWDQTQKLQTPLGKAFLWKAHTKEDEDGLVGGHIITGFVDKYDVYLIQVITAPDSPKGLELATAITNTLRVTKH